MSKFSESSEMGHDVRREAQGERRASPPLDLLTASSHSLLVSNGSTNSNVFTAITTPVRPHEGPPRKGSVRTQRSPGD